MKTLYFDESGNTGNDLMNREQKYFSLCSTDLDELSSCEMITKFFGPSRAAEVHFKNQKQSNIGKERILEFISENLAEIKNHCKLTVINKEFSVCCCLLLFCYEPLFYEKGIDYLDGGRNIVDANLFYYGLKAYCGAEFSYNLYTAFVNYVNHRKTDEKNKLTDLLSEAIGKAEGWFSNLFLSPLFYSFKEKDGFLPDFNFLDPAVYSLSGLLQEWMKTSDEKVCVCHDEAIVLESKISDLYDLFQEDAKDEIYLGYGEHKFPFPLRVRKPVSFASSSVSFSIQLCDILAGATTYIFNNEEKAFAKDLRKVMNDISFVEPIMPKLDFKLSIGRMKQCGDINAIEYLTDYFYKLNEM